MDDNSFGVGDQQGQPNNMATGTPGQEYSQQGPSQPAQQVFPYQQQPNYVNPAGGSVGQPNGAAYAPVPSNQDDENAKLERRNKIIAYSVAGAAAVILLAIVAFVVLNAVKPSTHKHALAVLNKVSGVAEVHKVSPSSDHYDQKTDWLHSDSTRAFFMETKKSPDKTLFKSANSPAEGVNKYAATMRKLARDKSLMGDKKLRTQVKVSEKLFVEFKKRVAATTKFFALIKPFSDKMKQVESSSEKQPARTKQMEELMGKLAEACGKFKSLDRKFDDLAKSTCNNLHGSAAALVKPNAAETELPEPLKKDFSAMSTYFNNTVGYRNRFVMSLMTLHAAISKAK